MSSVNHTMPNDFPVTSVRRVSPRLSARPVMFLLAGLGMISAVVIVILGEKTSGISLPVWNVALIACQGVTGLLGLRVLVSSLIARGSKSSLRERLSTMATGGVLVAAAVAGVGLVLVVTGLFGLRLTLTGVSAVRVRFGRRRP